MGTLVRFPTPPPPAPPSLDVLERLAVCCDCQHSGACPYRSGCPYHEGEPLPRKGA